ncbi:MAG: endonuclease [Acholeplasmatales bacterium]|nr:endonuclease [Acholeplasmatales bacterium]
MRKKVVRAIGLTLGALSLASCEKLSIAVEQNEVVVEPEKKDDNENNGEKETPSQGGEENKQTPEENKPAETQNEKKKLTVSGTFETERPLDEKLTKQISSNKVESSTNFKCQYSGKANTVTITLPVPFKVIEGETTYEASQVENNYILKISKEEIGEYKFNLISTETNEYAEKNVFFRITVKEAQGEITSNYKEQFVYKPEGNKLTFSRYKDKGSQYVVTLKNSNGEIIETQNSKIEGKKYICEFILKDAGTYLFEAVSPADDNFKYETKFNGEVNVAKASAPVTYNKVENFVYDGTAHTLSIESSIDLEVKVNDTVVEAKDGKYTYDFIDAGTYTISVNSKDENYTEFKMEETLEVSKEESNVNVYIDDVASNKEKVCVRSGNHNVLVISKYSFEAVLDDVKYSSSLDEVDNLYKVQIEVSSIDTKVYNITYSIQETPNVKGLDFVQEIIIITDAISYSLTFDEKTELTKEYDGANHQVLFKSDEDAFSVIYGEKTVDSINNEVSFDIKDAGKHTFIIKHKNWQEEVSVEILKAQFEVEVFDKDNNKLDSLKDLERGDYKIVSDVLFSINDSEASLVNGKYEYIYTLTKDSELTIVSLNNNYKNSSLEFVVHKKLFVLDNTNNEERGVPSAYYDTLNLSYVDVDFRENLSELINKDFVHYTYKKAYDILNETDVDPDNENNVICMYSGKSIKNTDHSSITGFNREHTWAKSHGFGNQKTYETSNPWCDVHHLRATWCNINSTRNNSDFYEFGPDETYKEMFGCKYNDTHFEPRDEVKGDVARMMFYMATMYGFDGKFNLSLTNDSTTASSDGNGVFGNLDTLVKWSLEDPVSSTEIHRNNVAYKYQKNRNPYIDHPELVQIAYPESYAKYADLTADQSKVDTVISEINKLPETITLENEKLVNDTYALYDKLNWVERSLVTNYETLHQATLNILNLNFKKDEVESGDISIALDSPKKETSGNSGYKANNNIITDLGTIKCSYANIDKSSVTLGANSKAIANAKTNEFGIDSNLASASMKLDFYVDNVEKVNFTCGSVSDKMNYKLFYTEDDTNYVEFASGSLAVNKETITNISGSFDTPKKCKVVLVITTQSKPGKNTNLRLTVSKIDIYQA